MYSLKEWNKTVLKTIAMSILLTVLATTITIIIVSISNIRIDITKVYNIFSISTFTILVFVFTVRNFIAFKTNFKLYELKKDELHPDYFFNKYHSYLESVSFENKMAEKMLYISEEYEQAKNYEKAFEIMKSINIKKLSSLLLARYYCCLAYLYIMVNELEGAKNILQIGGFYLEKYKHKNDIGGRIFRTFGLLEYSQGNFQKAENYLMNAKTLSFSNEEIVKNEIILGHIYLKTNRKEYAKDLAIKASKVVEFKRQREDLIELIENIEKSFLEATK